MLVKLESSEPIEHLHAAVLARNSLLLITAPSETTVPAFLATPASRVDETEALDA